ncbi:MAG TPA: Gfo/Idh/MocA family oxidoreductase [Pirellulaceae bacterium]|nr:Gfo/Idh/MocA family oxidoreductase [Pirellulaceae bacterium]
MPRNVHSRRQFITTTAAGVVALSVPAIGRAQNTNSRINLAFIGVGGRGGANLKEMTKTASENVVALCDVNGNNLDAMGERYPQARKYRDFRKLYDEAKDIDAVVVSTCEHTHAYATLPALQMGKPVYCEKPLTLNVAEARLVSQAAAKAKVPTQMGTQIHASPNYHRVVELIQSGAIGKVSEAHVWVSRAWGRQSKEEAEANKDIVFVTERPAEAQDPPPYLDWDLWIGPAPYRPFHSVYFPGPKWYRWWDFGNGTMSDLGSHWNDLPFWALKLDAPQTIEATGPEPHPEIAPASMTAVYEYGERDGGKLPPVRLTWYQGTYKPPQWQENPAVRAFGSGVLFVGEGGKMLVSDYSRHVLLPEADFKDFQRPEPFVPDSPGQQLEWLAAIRNGTPTGSPFHPYAGLLTEANHLGNVAYRAGQKIHWDSANLRVTNTRAADPYLSREPREGWKLG